MSETVKAVGLIDLEWELHGGRGPRRFGSPLHGGHATSLRWGVARTDLGRVRDQLELHGHAAMREGPAHVGLEDPTDLIKDINKSLKFIK